MNKSSELKHLQVHADNLSNEIKLLDENRQSINKNINNKQQELNTINKKISEFTLSAPIVTEHALLRYIERILGIDLDKITNDILTEQNIKTIDFAGSCKIKSSGVEFIVKDRKVISVVK
jgi:hypothetical protein